MTMRPGPRMARSVWSRCLQLSRGPWSPCWMVPKAPRGCGRHGLGRARRCGGPLFLQLHSWLVSLSAIEGGRAMAPSNGRGVRACVDGRLCLVVRLVSETHDRAVHSESGAPRAVVQVILLGSSCLQFGHARSSVTELRQQRYTRPGSARVYVLVAILRGAGVRRGL